MAKNYRNYHVPMCHEFFPGYINRMPPSINTKMIMAVIGIPVLIYNLSKSKDNKIDDGVIF